MAMEGISLIEYIDPHSSKRHYQRMLRESGLDI